MICQLAAALSERGHDVHLFSLDDEDARSYFEISPCVTWHRFAQDDRLSGKIDRVGRMTKVLKENGIRVIVGFVMSGDKTVYAAAKIAGARLVAAERNGPSMYRIRYGVRQRLLSFGLLHLCDSIAVQFPDYIAGYPRTVRGRISSIPNPVASCARRAAPAQPDSRGRFQLLAVSRLDDVQKRLDVLVRSFALIAAEHPQWYLRIVGHGPFELPLRGLVADCGMNERIVIEAPTKQIGEVYANANLFVMPSAWEGFPNALAEALSTGLPAVGFAAAEGVAQLITHGRTGWLAGPGDEAQSLARALAEAMDNGVERRRRGALATQAMLEFAPEAQYARWFQLLDSLTGRREA